MSSLLITDFIFASIFILLLVSFITFNFMLIFNKLKELSEFEYNDILISSFSSMDFIEAESYPAYSDSFPDLGHTGKLILDCFTGICQELDSSNELIDIINYRCSEQCSYNGKCICSYHNDKKGTCSRKYDDNYENGKYCYAFNTIYFWKGKKYTILKKDGYTYYNNSILKDEECPKDTINCGIIDDNENQLCIQQNYSCPINYFSESKLNENKLHSNVKIGNKTFYYTFDDNNKTKRKIIAGLIADSDLYLNENNDQKVLIDIGTISEFLIDNKNLYKEVELGYDPYKEDDIDSKGNSYLRFFYNDKVDLSNLKKNIDEYNFNHTKNDDFVKPINKKIKRTSIVGLAASGALLIAIIFYFVFKRDCWGCSIFNIVVFAVYIIVSLIYGCLNISNFNDLRDMDPNDNNLARKINIVIVIVGFVLFAYTIFAIIYLKKLRDKFEDYSWNKCNKKKEAFII